MVFDNACDTQSNAAFLNSTQHTHKYNTHLNST